MCGGNQVIWSQNSIISLMMKGKTKGEREKKKRGTIRLLACSILAQNG